MYSDEAQVFAWLSARFLCAQRPRIYGAPAAFLEAKNYEGCEARCPGAELCRYHGYRPKVFQEGEGFVVRYVQCARFGERRREAGPTGFPVPPRYSRCLFASFETNGDKLLLAARNLASGCAARGFSMLLLGPSGSGKTHLACAMAAEAASRGASVLFVTLADYFEALKSNISGLSDAERAMRCAGFAIIDDAGALRCTEWCSQKFFSAIDSRYRAGLPTAVTSDAADAAAFAECAGPRGAMILSRLCDKASSRWINLKGAPDRRRELPQQQKLLESGNEA